MSTPMEGTVKGAEMDPEEQIIFMAANALSEGTLDLFRLAINTANIEGYDETQFHQVLFFLLSVAVEMERYDLCKLVMETFSKRNVQEDTFPLDASIYTSNIYPESCLKMVAKTSQRTFQDIMTILYSRDSSPQINYACEMVHKVYGPQTYEIYTELLNTFREDRLVEGGAYNEMVFDFLHDRRRDLGALMEKPTWVRNFRKSTRLPQSAQVKPLAIDYKKYPSVKQVVDALMEVKEVRDEEDESTKWQYEDITRATVAVAQPSTRLRLLGIEPGENLEKREVITFRALGPLNTSSKYDPDNSLGLVCNEHGGCRMFLCNEWETGNEEGDEEVDWFTGYCQMCDMKIPNRIWALRHPMDGGGWQGCYCSQKCVLEGNPEWMDDNLAAFGAVMVQLNEMGIQDRY